MGVQSESEFDEFYAATWPRLFRVAYAVAGDRQYAEDALQDAYARAHHSWMSVQASRDPYAYVRRIVINAAISDRRRAWRRRERVVEQVAEHAQAAEPGVDRYLVWPAVLDLPARQRAVVVLRYYEDLSEAQIAEVLGCRPGTVKSQAAAALATLRHRLGQPAGEELS